MVMFWGSLFTVSSWMVTLQWSCQICINNAQIQKQGTVNVFFAMHSHAVIPSFAWKKFFPSALLKLISFSLLSLTKFITRNGLLEFKVLSMWIYIVSLWKSGQMSLQLVLWENFFLSAMLMFRCPFSLSANCYAALFCSRSGRDLWSLVTICFKGEKKMKMLLIKPFEPLQWLMCNFSLQYHLWISH